MYSSLYFQINYTFVYEEYEKIKKYKDISEIKYIINSKQQEYICSNKKTEKIKSNEIHTKEQEKELAIVLIKSNLMELPSFHINKLYSNKIKWKPKKIENLVYKL